LAGGSFGGLAAAPRGRARVRGRNLMTLIAGIFSRGGQSVADADCASLSQLISRNPTDEVKTFRDHRSFFAKLDIVAFGEPGSFTDANGAMSLLAGDPLLSSGGTGRLQDLTVIHKQALR